MTSEIERQHKVGASGILVDACFLAGEIVDFYDVVAGPRSPCSRALRWLGLNEKAVIEQPENDDGNDATGTKSRSVETEILCHFVPWNFCRRSGIATVELLTHWI
jgi:hypothetical protein